MSTQPRAAGRSTFERALPLGYLAVALVIVATLLPTSLRPPPEDPTTSAEFSPDAPPDDNPDAIVANFNRGQSATAGGGEGTGGPPAASAIGPAPPRACPRGFGTPPRQSESLYAPPCAAAFTGSNGGATHAGVTATEIRIAVSGVTAATPSREGCYNDQPQPTENAVDRTFRALQTYFNQVFQLWKRTIVLCAVQFGANATEQRAAAAQVVQEFNAFGYAWSSSVACAELKRHDRVCFTSQFPADWFRQQEPSAYSWYMDGTKLGRFASEYVCKKLVGKPAVYAGDPLLQGTKRKFGILYYDHPDFRSNADNLEQLLTAECRAPLGSSVGYNIDTGDGQANLSTAMTRFRADGVTTIIPLNDYLTNAVATNAADGNGYAPEWFTVGYGAVDRNRLARVQNQKQWARAFGLTSLDMQLPLAETDCYRAYHSIDPAAEPNSTICEFAFPSLHMMVAGIQQAGPKLTPVNFQQGLHSIGYRFYDDEVWAIGGGFGPDDFTYTDNVAEFWWDPTAIDPADNQTRGAYRYVRGGQRYRLGELPKEDPLVFKDGTTRPQGG